MKWTKLAIGSSVLVGAAAITSVQFGALDYFRLSARVQQLEQEKGRLVEYARRLGASRRMAQVDVTAQTTSPDGRTHTTMRWQQIGPDGTLGIPETIEIDGTLAYFEALVIKFEYQHVGEGDPQRGASLALFRRAFGDLQPPETGMPLDRVAPPTAAANADEANLHARLWKRFWDLVDDPKLAADFGVRVAQIEAPAVPVKPGDIWEIALDAAGGLNLRKAGYRPPSQTTTNRTNTTAASRDTSDQ